MRTEMGDSSVNFNSHSRMQHTAVAVQRTLAHTGIHSNALLALSLLSLF